MPARLVKVCITSLAPSAAALIFQASGKLTRYPVAVNLPDLHQMLLLNLILQQVPAIKWLQLEYYPAVDSQASQLVAYNLPSPGYLLLPHLRTILTLPNMLDRILAAWLNLNLKLLAESD